MYILINKRPFKVFDLKVSDILQLDIQTVQLMCKAGMNAIRGIDASDFERKELEALKELYEKSGMKPEKITDEEYQKLYCGQQWKRTENLVLFSTDSYSDNKIYKVYFEPQSYYFSVRDGERIQYSKLYSSKEEAERARNRVLHRANALISKLLRVEI